MVRFRIIFYIEDCLILDSFYNTNIQACPDMTKAKRGLDGQSFILLLYMYDYAIEGT